MKEIQIDDKGCVEIVFNVCFGGFGISKAALDRMIELGSEEAKQTLARYETYGWGNYNSYNISVPRIDPILVQVVKELKEKANGENSTLAIGKINFINLISNCIEEYDGKEEIKGCYDYVVYDGEEE